MSIGIFLRKNVVMTVAFIAAFITSMIVPPDAKYLSYFDFKTLTCLFCVLAVVCALKNVNFLTTKFILKIFTTALTHEKPPFFPLLGRKFGGFYGFSVLY